MDRRRHVLIAVPGRARPAHLFADRGERATEKALESSAEVVVVRHHDLSPHDGIAALLRY